MTRVQFTHRHHHHPD
ncbi:MULTISPECIES: his operon leader peptide [Erwinia]|nr:MULTISPECIES: his operon leader peptide [Erwinia]